MCVRKTAEAEQDRKQASELKSRLLGPSVNVGSTTSSRNLPFLSRIDRFGRVLRRFFPQTGLSDAPLILANVLSNEKWKLF
jgi:hypothetical protein